MRQDSVEQARLLFETSELLRDFVVRKHMAHMRANGEPEIDITVPQMHALHIIRTQKKVSIKELAAAANVSAPSASAMVDRLLEMGMVSREPNPADRREVVVRLTDESKAIIMEIEQHVLGSLADLFVEIGPEYTRLWQQVYGKIHGVLSEKLRSRIAGND